jgi:hypothetical protein
MSRHPPPLLPPRGGAPPWLLLAGVLLGVAAAMVVLALALGLKLAPVLGDRLAGSATVAVSGRMDGGALESSDAAAARAREIVAAERPVAAARVLEPGSLDPLVAHILGAPRVSGEAGPPRLLAVTWQSGARGDTAALARDLRREGLAAGLDDHGLWSGPVERTALVAVGVALLVLLGIVLLGAALGSIAATRRSELAWDRLGLLARLGGEPAPLVSAIASAAGACLGLAVAAGAVALVAIDWAAPPDLGLPRGFTADLPAALTMVSGVAVVAGLAAGAAAAQTARRGLRGMFE